MKAGITVLSVLALSSVGWVSNAAAAPDRETRPVAGFEAIEVGGSIELRVHQGEAFLVEVESPDGAASELLTEVGSGTLRLRYDRPRNTFFSSWTPHRHTVHVTLPKLVALTASGGSHVDGEGAFTGSKLALTVSGGAKVRLDVAVDALDVRTSGGSDLWLTGTAGTASLQSSGGSDLDASRLKAESAQVSGSGGSDIWIGESATLVAHASGGSDIRYAGEPRSLSIEKSGGGGVRRSDRR